LSWSSAGAIVIGTYISLVVRTWPPSSAGEALAAGALWLGMTVAFEFFMGLVLAKRPLTRVLADYDVRAGRVWVFFLIWLTVAPLLFYRLRPA
jgi:cobalamin biosynthesis protein CobD/CbiB